MAEGARLESVFRGNSNVGSNPTLSAITCSDENFDIDPPTRYTKALQNLRIDPGRLVSKLLDIFNIGARIHSGIAVRAALTAQFEHT